MTRPTLCVFCGSARGADPRHADDARRLGRACAEAGVALVTGGGAVGLMGVVADAALAAGGAVTGVIPGFLERREIAHRGLGKIVVTRDMSERKQRMFTLADAFVALPGGAGTLDEALEMLTWRLLGLHDKPVMLFDSAYWRPLLALFDHMAANGFLNPGALPLCEPVDDVASVVHRAAGVAGTAPA